MAESRIGRKNADDVLLASLAVGATIEDAAAKAGIAKRTAQRRMEDPDFTQRLRQSAPQPWGERRLCSPHRA